MILRSCRTIAVIGLIFSSIPSSAVTLSQVYGSDLTKQTQTMFVRAEAGWTTYESQAAESNGTASSMSYTLGGYAGENRVLGAFFTATDFEMPFELNRSRVKRSVRDIRVQARFAFIYPSIIVSQSDTSVIMDAVGESEAATLNLSPREREVVCDIFGNNIGAGLAVFAPITDKIVIHADATVMQAAKGSDRNGKQVELGARQDIEIATNVDLTKDMVDLVMGYRMQKFSLAVDGVNYKESMSTPYAGLQLGVYF